MARAFTHYWKNTTWKGHEVGGEALGHTASNEFRASKVRPGDRIFIVTNIEGVLHLGGALPVDKVVGQREANRIFGEKVWTATDHAIGRGAQPFYKKLRVPLRTAKALRFAGDKPLVFKTAGKLDQQTLRGVRELTLESAEMLDELLRQAEGGTSTSRNQGFGAHSLQDLRNDPDAVRAVFDVIFDSVTPESRRRWEAFLADSLEYANSHPNSWALALHRTYIRLNVGMVLCVQFHPDHGATLLLDRKSAPHGQLKVLRGKHMYSPGCIDALIPFAEAEETIDRIRIASRGAIDICADAHGGNGAFRGAHSPGVIRHLEGILGRKLPNPGYWGPNSEDDLTETTSPTDDETLGSHPFADEWAQERAILDDATVSVTEREAVILARRGQGVFREKVLGVEPRCRVTGVTDVSCLVASHIKPWSESTNYERVSAFNGLMLAPHVDHLFDQGFISFTDNGDLLVSTKCSAEVLAAWGISPTLNVRPFSGAQRPFLAYHRHKHEFKI
jgi:hypothetical protein